jgi:hypothetical protein
MIRNSGLNPTPLDSRDFRLGSITTLPPLSEIPDHFMVGEPVIKNQKDSDFCTAFAACAISELQEGVELSPEWSFAVTKKIDGDKDTYGADIRTAMKAHTKHGAIAQADAPFSIDKKSPDFLRDIANWPSDLFKKAPQHIKQSFVQITGPYDHFDNICATLWKYRAEHRGAVTGLIFGWARTDHVLRTIPNAGYGHALAIVGKETIKGVPHLVYQNSYGTQVGDNGFHYLPRDVVNYFVNIYGAYMFIDMPPEQVRYMLDHGITDKDNWIIQLMKVAVSLLKKLLDQKKTS